MEVNFNRKVFNRSTQTDVSPAQLKQDIAELLAAYEQVDSDLKRQTRSQLVNTTAYAGLIEYVKDLEGGFESIYKAFHKLYFERKSSTNSVTNAETLWKKYLDAREEVIGELMKVRRRLFKGNLLTRFVGEKNSPNWKEATSLNAIAAGTEKKNIIRSTIYESFSRWKSTLNKMESNNAVSLWYERAVIDYNQLAYAANTILEPSSKQRIILKKKPGAENNSLARTSFRQSANMGDSVLVENGNGEVVGLRPSNNIDVAIVPGNPAPPLPPRGWFGAAYDTVANAAGRTAAFVTGKPLLAAAGVGAAAIGTGAQYLLNTAAPVAAPLYQPVVNFAAPLASQAAGYAGQALGYAAPYYDQALGYVAPIASQAGTYLAEIDPTTAAIVGTASLAAIGGMVALKKKFMTKAEEKKAIETLESATNKLEQRGSRVSQRASQKTGSVATAESFALAENSIEAAATNARMAIENAKRVTGDRKSQAIAVAAEAVLDLGAKVARTSRAADRIPIQVMGQQTVTFVPTEEIIQPVILPFSDLPRVNARDVNSTRFRTSFKPKARTPSPGRKGSAKTITTTVRGKPVGKKTPAKRPSPRGGSRTGTRSVSPKRAATKKTPVKRRATSSPVKRGRSPNKSSTTKKRAAPRSASPRARARK